MPPSLALCLFGLLILWLFARDAKRPTRISAALWIPLAWAFIIGSRPISLWLSGGVEIPAGGFQDKVVDKAVFLFLIIAGLFVLWRRRVDSRRIIDRNRWLLVYFLYLGVSALWADEPFVSFKRWIKYFGNVVMVLVVLSEKDPGGAVRALFARSAYLMVPLSVLLIKYYPSISRGYNQWTFQPGFTGITTGKNLLGMSLFVCGLSLFWMLLELRDAPERNKDKTTLFSYCGLLVMTAWLLHKAQSSTASACTALGIGILLAMRVPALRNQVNRLGVYVAGIAVLVALLQGSGLWGLAVKGFAEFVGRDPTLHGRHEIWETVLKEDINPLIGTGYYSFWSEERNQRLSEKYYYSLGVAHNGYIETYLSSGLIGLFLLIAMIASALRGIRREMLLGSGFGTLRLVFMILILLYNFSESIFDRLGIVWFTFLLVMMEYPRLAKPAPQAGTSRHLGARDSVFAARTPVGSPSSVAYS